MSLLRSRVGRESQASGSGSLFHNLSGHHIVVRRWQSYLARARHSTQLTTCAFLIGCFVIISLENMSLFL